ncbi:fungal-specific transcription factor domain-containing protein [Flagelloscypha sp. PMI_526]|nr:fungal-specific transcription factor domain-containing protein [Flagelloscypha sp. PMI_526]
MENVIISEQKSKTTISRMSRGLVACAECKRMKLKCDKKVPCSSCVRRECSSICPTGILVSRQASRSLLAEGSPVRRSQDVIDGLRERSLQLEDALAIAHSHISKDVHPLLAESPQRGRPQDDSEVDKVTEVLGTLTVGEVGDLKYFGPSAIAEHVYQSDSTEDKLISALVSPQQDSGSTIENFSTRVPLGPPLSMESFVSTILRDLPEKKRAWALCRSFYERYAISSMPIQQKELAQSYLTPMYRYLEDSSHDNNLPIPSTPFRPHRCAVGFFTFALGAWLDLNQEHYWVEADRYFQIGMLCLSMQSLFYSPEVASVEALFLLTYYHELRGAASTSTTSPSWTILSLASKISQGLGLHRDPAKWNLDIATVQHRRWLYWELTTMELFLSLGTGRPTSNKASYVDTELPDDVGPTDAHGELLEGFFRWKHAAVRDCYLDVAETLLAALPVKYEVVLELDRKVRAKEIPAHLNRIIINAEDGPNLTLPDFMHTCILGVVRSMVLLAIHRGHLVEALKDSSGNPLKSRYAPSFYPVIEQHLGSSKVTMQPKDDFLL